MKPLVVTLVIVTCALAIHTQAPTASATHSFPELYLWPDLQTGGDGRVSYGLCGDGSAGEASWDDGVENWDLSLGPLMEFDLASCASPPQTQLKWETADECGLGADGTPALACWLPIAPIDVGSYFQLQLAVIFFDRVVYPPYSANWEKLIVAHEWGHNLSLDHHPQSGPCAARSVMTSAFGQDPTTCGMALPSETDRYSARCHRPTFIDSASGAGRYPGVFRPQVNGTGWYEEFQNAYSPPTDRFFFFAANCDIPVVGDWNGNGVDTPGIFRPYGPTGSEWHLSNSVTGSSPFIFVYGTSTDYPIVGDWDGDGDDTIGIYRPIGPTFSEWHLRDTNSVGEANYIFQYGTPADRPVVGDWDNDNDVTIGVFRPSDATWHLRNVNGIGLPSITPFAYGVPWDYPVTGDWDWDGDDTIGVVRRQASAAQWHLRNTNSAGPYNIVPFLFGIFSDKAITGDWN